jgi:hypothetical protein
MWAGFAICLLSTLSGAPESSHSARRWRADRGYPDSIEGARATWTDERLDDLSRRIDAGFARVDEDLRAMRTELAQAARTDALSARIDALQRTMIQVGGGMIATLVAGFAALVAAHLA